MKELGLWQKIRLVGDLVCDIKDAYDDDNKIDTFEIIEIGEKIISKIDIDMSKKTEQYLDIVKNIALWFDKSSKDGTITATEIIQLLDDLALKHGYDFDKSGITFK